jgi:pimeloyl-ACP methyl ester carboxylesterase
MARSGRALPILLLLAFAAFGPAAAAVSTCDPAGAQASGAIYRICMPATWNGDLVIYAHGYVGFNEPVAIPEDQLNLPDGTSVPELINSLGFAFATTSYSTNGLAIVQGVDDVVDLASLFAAAHGRARRIFLVGPSEGGLVTALAVERHPEVFAGGLSACGPIGDFRGQINYDGDFRVVFDYFFPGVLPGSAVDVPAALIDDFFAVYEPAIRAAVAANPGAARQLLAVTRAPVDAADPATVEETILGLAWYVVFGNNDARAKLGGQPFGNMFRMYRGSDDDAALNRGVARFFPDLTALGAMQSSYQTTGRLSRPLVTLHTTGDPIIPYWHQPLYTFKTLLTGSFGRHINIPIARYGHCRFNAPEVLVGFAILLFMSGSPDAPALEAALPDEAGRAEFRALVRQYGAAP